ncbi:ribosomal oxygenase 2-like [Saccoglossus kowalevskii]|uniref:Bifunctional lysine-specific demethylase and histidyl-hydroxylase n=1 Tax=Saccoglossus kowalevskii TaxID=10224 RepID=A0ABM0GNN0_SACKO|nr:PREDICTED: bifunctional lysine-specific demethylase and histidyl-hydroxylase MINA-like [Saccoglossus kowalevskii]
MKRKSGAQEKARKRLPTNVESASDGPVNETPPLSDGSHLDSRVGSHLDFISENYLDTDSNTIDSATDGHFNFSSQALLLESIISPVKLENFFQDYWEKKPLILHGEGSKRAAYFKQLFSMKQLRVISKKNSVRFVEDVNCCRYVNGKRESLNEDGDATVEKINRIFSGLKGTLQFHQPQRFQDELWKIQSNLESLFGCLVGANVYITPAESQGLAPHHDDVEVFIFQLEGEKHWRLYKPSLDLPRDYSRDLSQNEIGDPTHDFILKPGDVMYFPRGTIHQADTLSSSTHSTHITMSTYQHNTWGDLLSVMMPNLLEKEMDKNKEFRRGIPGTLITQGISKPNGEHLKMLLHQLAESIESCDDSSANEMKLDFISNRLPPYHNNTEELQSPKPPMPSNKSSVRLRFPDHTLIINGNPNDEDDSDEEEDDEDDGEDEECVYVYHSLQNNRRCHMMSAEKTKPTGLKFSMDHIEALQQLKTAGNQYIKVKQIKLQDKPRKDMLLSLWSEGLLQCKE